MPTAPLCAVPGSGSGSAASHAPIRVVLADDHAFLRHSLRQLLDRETEFEVVAEAGDNSTALQQVCDHHPHVLVLDVDMPGSARLTAVRQIRSAAPATTIVVTTMTDEPRFAREAIAAGASGYVLKDSADQDLPEAVRRAAKGESFIAPEVASRLTIHAARGEDTLSERELEVLRLIALGYTNAEIGQTLEISIRTVETHRAHIHRKLGLSTRAELVRYALRRGLLHDAVRHDGAR
ncbi:MAG: response regulator transcription factor [Solirubrobacteraceae bacterium]|jgi:two-component system response regulator NreC